MTSKLHSLLKIFFRVHSYLQADPLLELHQNFDGMEEINKDIEAMEVAVKAIQNQSKQILEKLKSKLKLEDADHMVRTVVLHETDDFNHLSHNQPKWEINMIKGLVQKIIDKIIVLQQHQILSHDNETLQKFKQFVDTPIEQIMFKNYFFVYILEIQSVLTANDVLRLISDFILNRNVITGNKQEDNPLMAVLTGKNPKSEPIERFFEEYGPELLAKFNRYSVAPDCSIAHTCDFLPILRVIMQDQKRFALYLPSEAPANLSIFRSVQASQIIQTKIEEFYYDILRIDPQIEGNGRFDLRMNIYIFKKILVYLLRADVLMLKDADFQPSSVSMPPSDARQTDINNPGEQMILSRFSENDYSLSYKLMWMVQQLRVSMENTLLSIEKDICFGVIQTITNHIRTLASFNLGFGNRNNEEMQLIQSCLNLSDMFMYYQQQSSDGSTSLTEAEKFGVFAEKLGLIKLAPNLSRNQFVVVCKKTLTNKKVKLDFGMFNEALLKVLLITHQNRTHVNNGLEDTILEVRSLFRLLKKDEPSRLAKANAGNERQKDGLDRSVIFKSYNMSILASPIVKNDGKGYEPMFSSGPSRKRYLSTIIPKDGRYRIASLKPLAPPLVVGRRVFRES